MSGYFDALGDEAAKAALLAMTKPRGSRYPLDRTFSWEGHAVATNGKGLLVVFGRAALADEPAPGFLAEHLAGSILGPKDLPAIDWPSGELPSLPPLFKCTWCNGSGSTTCPDCDGVSACCVSSGVVACDECGGSGDASVTDRAAPDFVHLRMPGGEMLVDASRLGGDLHALSTPTHGTVDQRTHHPALVLAGAGWRYVLMSGNPEVAEAKRDVVVPSAGEVVL